MQDLYNTNKDFRDYVDRYCRNKPFGVEQALRHIQVRLVGHYYRELEQKKSNTSVEIGRE